MPPSVSKTERTSSFYQKLSFTLDDLALLDPKLWLEERIRNPLLPGTWELKVYAKEDPPSVEFRVRFRGKVPPTFGTNVEVHSTLSWIAPDGRIVHAEGPASFPLARTLPVPKSSGFLHNIPYTRLEQYANDSGGRYKPETQRRYLFEFELRSAACPDPKVKAENLSTLYSSPLPNDLRLFFPRPGGGLALWARTNALPPTLQEYLQINCQFVSAPKTGRGRRSITSSAIPRAVFESCYDKIDDYPDSDEEADQVYAANLGFSPVDPTDLPTPNSFRQVNFEYFRYSTLKALLVYLDSGHIRFSPLRSFFSAPLSPSTRMSFLKKSLTDEPKLPLPVSPKSVYLLARDFDLRPLEELALLTYVSSLTVSTAAAELFSPLSLAHEEVQKAIIEFVADHWAEIRESQSYKDIVARIKREEIKGAGSVLVDLIVAVQAD
ncbi:uncharacterized protein JCM6883_004365 [Sporobolomyces salmoneus]|uniref:uncharacterized protein n=1 Tax=Sporobolomyces salmoneus TaxID=183962 RepID=UPI00317B1C97